MADIFDTEWRSRSSGINCPLRSNAVGRVPLQRDRLCVSTIIFDKLSMKTGFSEAAPSARRSLWRAPLPCDRDGETHRATPAAAVTIPPTYRFGVDSRRSLLPAVCPDRQNGRRHSIPIRSSLRQVAVLSSRIRLEHNHLHDSTQDFASSLRGRQDSDKLASPSEDVLPHTAASRESIATATRRRERLRGNSA